MAFTSRSLPSLPDFPLRQGLLTLSSSYVYYYLHQSRLLSTDGRLGFHNLALILTEGGETDVNNRVVKSLFR
jgi:hypothetical protein